jgi:hypothetical protein
MPVLSSEPLVATTFVTSRYYYILITSLVSNKPQDEGSVLARASLRRTPEHSLQGPRKEVGKDVLGLYQRFSKVWLPDEGNRL